MMKTISTEYIKAYLLGLQTQVCNVIESEIKPEHKFTEDRWVYGEGGGGITKILTSDDIIEKAAVNFSHITGASLPQAATLKRPHLANAEFEALGVSIIIHPKNPFIPTTHANVRFILVKTKPEPIWWFGGGFDLTPYYGFEEDCIHWHKMAKAACDPLGVDIYERYKKWCDQYFYLPHRQEPRGIGGLFFDDLNEWEFEKCFQFMKSIGDHFIKAYQPILARRKNFSYNEKHREFQLYRRGRYVEFNLLYDRGTLFGLQSQGRVESILASMPPNVSWKYNWIPEPGSEEERLYKEFLKAKDWFR